MAGQNSLTIANEEYLNQAEEEIRSYGNLVIAAIVAIGRKLVEIKARIGHGSYEQFIERRLGFTSRTARNYVNAYELLKSETVSDLRVDARSVYRLAAPSTPQEARIEALARAATPQGISCIEVDELIAASKIVTSLDARNEAEKQVAEEPAVLDEPLRQPELALTQSEQRKPSPGSTLPIKIKKPLSPLENTLSRRAAKARRVINRCSAMLALGPAEYLEAEIAAQVHLRSDLARDRLEQIASDIASLYEWFGGFLELYKQRIKRQQIGHGGDFFSTGDLIGTTPEPDQELAEQPSLPFVFTTFTPAIIDQADVV